MVWIWEPTNETHLHYHRNDCLIHLRVRVSHAFEPLVLQLHNARSSPFLQVYSVVCHLGWQIWTCKRSVVTHYFKYWQKMKSRTSLWNVFFERILWHPLYFSVCSGSGADVSIVMSDSSSGIFVVNQGIIQHFSWSQKYRLWKKIIVSWILRKHIVFNQRLYCAARSIEHSISPGNIKWDMADWRALVIRHHTFGHKTISG